MKNALDESTVDRKRYPLRIETFPGTPPMFLTELGVYKSGAGFYIGRMCWNLEFDGFEEPGTRESEDYFPTREAAQEALDTKRFRVRDCSENEMLYAAGCPRPPESDHDVDCIDIHCTRCGGCQTPDSGPCICYAR